MIDLTQIQDPSFIKQLNYKELESLGADIRAFLIENIAKTGGHLASNLGIVELTLGLHKVFESPKDKFIFDVGHQAYVHKILTGRANQFHTLRRLDGLSGYTKRSESVHDVWESGHAATSISAAAGFLHAKKTNPEIGEVIAIIGDASIAGGMAFEALNYLGSAKGAKPIIILNDNKMGISKSVGAFSNLLTVLRGNRVFNRVKRITYRILPHFLIALIDRARRGIKGFLQRDNIFEDLGYAYLGPIYGNDIRSVVRVLTRAKKLNKSCVIHLITEKGFGYKHAEQDEIGDFHGIGPFDLESGKPVKGVAKNKHSWSEVISEGIIALQNKMRIDVVIPAMTVGAKFERFKSLYPERLIDVGIAEEHAATMASAMALNGIHVFLPLYATFAQRAYDQILNDIARPNIPVVIGIDRAGIVGEDGSTHQGIFDVSMFSTMPNIKIAMPYDANEAYAMLKYAFEQKNPFVIRYPKGITTCEFDLIDFTPINETWTILNEGKDIVLISYGSGINRLKKAAEELQIDATIVNARFIKPIDTACLDYLARKQLPMLFYEEVEIQGALYPTVLRYFATQNITVRTDVIALENTVVSHGQIEEVLDRYNLNIDAIKAKIRGLL